MTSALLERQQIAPMFAERQPDQGPRIAFFSESVLPWVDGVSRTLGRLFDSMEESGREFRIYTPIAGSEAYSWGHRVRVLPSVPFPFHREYRVSMARWRQVAADLDAFRPDLLHACAPTPAGLFAQSYGRSRGIPVVSSFHTNYVDYFPYYHAGLLQGPAWYALRWFHNRCDATYVPSTSTLRDLQRRGFRKLGIWGRGVDCDLFNPQARDSELRRQLGAGESRPLLLLVSRLVKEKDLGDLVKMDRILRRQGLDYAFAIVGEGPWRQRLQRGLPSAHFPGQKTGAELARWYASADVFVFPSTTETFGNVVQEAMASALATVVVDRGGPPGIIEPGVSGLVARPRDPADLAEKVALLLTDAARRRSMGEAGRASALTRDWDSVNGALLQEYEEVVSMAKSGASIAATARRLPSGYSA